MSIMVIVLLRVFWSLVNVEVQVTSGMIHKIDSIKTTFGGEHLFVSDSINFNPLTFH